MEWSEFAQRFALELAGLDRDTILIVREREESRHYVQAMREPDLLYAESVSNNFLHGHLMLTHADEEVLIEAGWRPPVADRTRENWWTELPPESGHGAFALLADMMVTALRDVQGVRRPLDLVYECFHRHGTGLIELAGIGIDVAEPDRVTARRAAPVPAPVPSVPLEQRLLAARDRGDHAAYFDLLLDAELLLPASAPAVEDPGLTEYTTVLRDGVTHLPAFTSPQALIAAGYAGLHRRTTLAKLAGAWPDPAWVLMVNVGAPGEVGFDAALLSRLDAHANSSPTSTLSDGLPVLALPGPGDPPRLAAPGRPIRLPHGAQLLLGDELTAVWDASSGQWSATRVAAD
ncbi:hypothetical protein GCM10027589_22740 [Actinocorallia lasiicapitis]